MGGQHRRTQQNEFLNVRTHRLPQADQFIDRGRLYTRQAFCARLSLGKDMWIRWCQAGLPVIKRNGRQFIDGAGAIEFLLGGHPKLSEGDPPPASWDDEPIVGTGSAAEPKSRRRKKR